MIVCPQTIAAEEGREVLRRGGNAVDSAVTTAFVQGVIDPQMNGLGGCGVAVVYTTRDHPGDGRRLLSARRCPGQTRPVAAPLHREAADRYGYVCEGWVNDAGYQSVGVPGTVAGLDELLRRFGTIAWDQAVTPAVRYARDGFPVTGNVRSFSVVVMPSSPPPSSRRSQSEGRVSTGLVYVRQSRQKEYERTISPEVQEQACRALPAIQACDRVEVHTDLDRSGGSTSRRQGYQALVSRIEAERTPGEIAAVALYDQSRGFRNKLDAYHFFALLEVRPWIQVLFADGTIFDRTPAGELTYSIKAAVAEHERKEIGRRIRDAERYAIAKGQMVGAMPAGYRWEGSGRERQVVVDEPVAQIIRKVFELYASGRRSCRDIARRLNVEAQIRRASRSAGERTRWRRCWATRPTSGRPGLEGGDTGGES